MLWRYLNTATCTRVPMSDIRKNTPNAGANFQPR